MLFVLDLTTVSEASDTNDLHCCIVISHNVQKQEALSVHLVLCGQIHHLRVALLMPFVQATHPVRCTVYTNLCHFVYLVKHAAAPFACPHQCHLSVLYAVLSYFV